MLITSYCRSDVLNAVEYTDTFTSITFIAVLMTPTTYFTYMDNSLA